MDLEHGVLNPVPLQPAKTDEMAHYWYYVVSHEKVIVFMRSHGKGYTFCDRFHPEHYTVFTQTGSSLKDVAVQINARGRFKVNKSLYFAHNSVME